MSRKSSGEAGLDFTPLPQANPQAGCEDSCKLERSRIFEKLQKSKIKFFFRRMMEYWNVGRRF